MQVAAQLEPRPALGRFYRVTPPPTARRHFDAVLIERVAPGFLAMPAPNQPLPLHAPLVALTGQILELPAYQRLYVTAVDADGALRLFELDLLTRQAREVPPRDGPARPYAARFLAAPDASKLYVQWLSAGFVPYTEIYDGQTLQWLGRTDEFQPDERAAGFEHQPPYLWTLDLADRPLLIDTQRDRIVRRFDYRRTFGPALAAVADIWRDLILVRLAVGHDRYQLVDAVSGEVGPPLDLAGYSQARARLVLGGRALVLIDVEPAAFPLGRRRLREPATARGSGAVWDLRSGRRLAEFHLAVPPELPSGALGTTADPGLPGRLWVHAPGDYERLDLELPACDRGVPRGDRVRATVQASWDSKTPLRYRYRVRVSGDSDAAAGALAIESGRETERTAAPAGWGIDRMGRDRWVRWSNGLGPDAEDIAPGTTRDRFVIAARPGTRPGIAPYRVQAAIGLARNCESDDRFLDNSARGYVAAPEAVSSTDPRKLARRLARLLDEACEIGWIQPGDCTALRAAADRLGSSPSVSRQAVNGFLQRLQRSRIEERSAVIVLGDAAAAVSEALEPSGD